jgi:hypothetical protein
VVRAGFLESRVHALDLGHALLEGAALLRELAQLLSDYFVVVHGGMMPQPVGRYLFPAGLYQRFRRVGPPVQPARLELALLDPQIACEAAYDFVCAEPTASELTAWRLVASAAEVLVNLPALPIGTEEATDS